MKLYTKISNREKEIIDLISKGLSANDIATQLYISSETVKSHKKRIFDKLDVLNSPMLVRRSYEMGILSLAS